MKLKNNRSLEEFWSNLNEVEFNEIKTSKEYFWYCEENRHYFKTKYCNLERTKQCPNCYGGRFLFGVNDFLTVNPEKEKLWSFKNNSSIRTVHYNSSEKYWWSCEKGHEYYASVRAVSNNTKCPICVNRQTHETVNSLQKLNSIVAKDWASTSLTPLELTPGSNKSIDWKCNARGHKETIPVYRRVKNGCRACKSILYSHPELAVRYHFENTENILYITSGSSKLVQWLCEAGHKYQNCVKNILRGDGCPYCSNKKVVKGVNDLESQNKQLLKLYSSKNKEIPDSVYHKSSKIFKWSCKKCFFEWSDKVINTYSCPKCFPRFRSNLEKDIFIELQKIVGAENVEHNSRVLVNEKELDLYIPKHALVIEANGSYWHSEAVISRKSKLTVEQFHLKRRDLIESYNLNLFYVWEKDWWSDKKSILNSLNLYFDKGVVNPIFLKNTEN